MKDIKPINVAYGLNEIINTLVGRPAHSDVKFHVQHGLRFGSAFSKRDLCTEKKFMFVWNKRFEKVWERVSDIPVATLGAPYLRYRRLMRYEKSPRAKGTVAFVCHSAPELEPVFDVDKYIDLLNSLPLEFQPVTICLFHKDLGRFQGRFEKAGFNVISAGPSTKPGFEFVDNQYKILGAHKFCTSHFLGSHALYAVDLGLPFSLLGDCRVVVKSSGQVVGEGKSGVVDPTVRAPYIDAFSGLHDRITQRQIELFEFEGGVNDWLEVDELKILFDRKGL